MKINPYTQAPATRFDSEIAKGIAARVVIGKGDGAPNFCMRVFETDLRDELYNAILRRSAAFFSRHTTGTLKCRA